MNFFAQNIKALRTKKGLKQAELAEKLGFPRTTWSSYESSVSQPNIDGLLVIAEFFGITVTQLLQNDLSDAHLLTEEPDAKKLPKSTPKRTPNRTPIQVSEPSLTTWGRVPHVITVDHQGRENIVYVPVRAKAGYLSGFADPEFVSQLPTYSLPGYSNKTFRMFEVEGHSMIPTFEDSDIVIGKFVENLAEIRNDRVHIIITKHDGLLIKRVFNRVVSDEKLILNSDNQKDPREYPPIVIAPDEVLEVWYIVGRFTRQMRPPGEVRNHLIDHEARLILLEKNMKKLLPGNGS